MLDRAILQFNRRIGDDVAVPEGVGRGAGVGSDHSIGSVVLDPHQRRLANLAGLGTFEGQHNDRFAVQRATPYTVGCFKLFALFAGSVVPARLVFAIQKHIEALPSKSVAFF